MRAFLLAVLLVIPALSPTPVSAGDHSSHQKVVLSGVTVQGTSSYRQSYRGYFLDLSEVTGRENYAEVERALRQQIDIVENVRLSPRVLKQFHEVPIVVDELACLSSPKEHPDAHALACYGELAPKRSQRTSPRAGTFWDSQKLRWSNPDPVDLAEDTKRGVIKVRPLSIDTREPVVLHELLHFYHQHILPEGFNDPAVLHHYNLAKGNQLYPANAYLMTNEKEFFAVTASVFLYGKAAQEPFTRAALKQKQPEYYNHLVWLFAFDPDRTPTASPVASAR
jgi:hypothetical protein